MGALSFSSIEVTIGSSADLIKSLKFIFLIFKHGKDHLLKRISKGIIIGNQEARFQLPELLSNLLFWVIRIILSNDEFGLFLALVCIFLEQAGVEEVAPI